MGRTEVTPFPDNPWHRIRKAAGIEEVRPHDLRRAVGSWLTQGGVDLNRVKDALRHANIETTSLGEDAAKPVMEEHAKRIIEAAGKHRPAEVVGLDRQKSNSNLTRLRSLPNPAATGPIYRPAGAAVYAAMPGQFRQGARLTLRDSEDNNDRVRDEK